MTSFNHKSIAVDLGPEVSPVIDTDVSRAAASLITDVAPVWCAGCGDYRFLETLRMALAYLKLDPDKVSIVTGIGCSGRTSGYVNTYGYHVVHGGAIPVAEGVHIGRDDLTTIVVGGDGDLLAIGAGYLPHAARRNPNLKVILLNNAIYGLTKGQESPTTQLRRTNTTPHGKVEDHINPIDLALTYKATFVGRAYAGNEAQKELAFWTLVAALSHRGFSLIDWPTSCSTYNPEDVGARVQRYTKMPEGLDVTDRDAATILARDPARTYYGIFHQVQRPTFVERLNAAARRAQGKRGLIGVNDLFDQFH